ncbi:unnamed protein product [Phytomonas sp. Hart1]|nr:unnamed protein product [Phytomonas sp. Hart1]|eukprot:CCW70382.1 unnamed protein product [Phytomonas sp. isolate Hart1]
MFRRTYVALKKGWTHNPGHTRRGGKNLAWRPKIPEEKLEQFVPLDLVHPRRRPNTWQERQFHFLGYTKWPKEIGFYNAGDNFELTPEASWRLFGLMHEASWWGRLHNERVIMHLLPLVEKDPKRFMPRVNDIFRLHLKRFGADHVIYNAVMQASAFAKDLARCEGLFREMRALGLEPNAQSYVNLMLAGRLCGKTREECAEYFHEGLRRKALFAVMRVDTEFSMWMDQLDRLGSFTAEKGYLSVNEEGASPMPRDMWALWGWHRSEGKFISRQAVIQQHVRARLQGGRQLIGTVYSSRRRQPWALYNGLLPMDFKGPIYRPPITFTPPPGHRREVAGKSY